MNALDFSPLFRSTIGFDRLAQLVDSAARPEPSYPPYNIEVVGENAYRLTMAVAGFTPEELDITAKDDTLVISGKAKSEEQAPRALYRGIARRAFERRFQLAEYIKVTGANLENGLLSVELVREVPEEKKPRKISIGGSPKVSLEQKAA
ncbi:MAG TPA: Hsp20 family protein [Stellaceae bacterium]|nr:Hsp20 family protein [Stellaceae bacterium]